MAILDYVEYGLGLLLFPVRGHDNKLFTRGPAFADFPSQTITVASPDCGTSGSTMAPKYGQLGEDRFPELSWSPPPTQPPSSPSAEIKEYLLISEDADAPIPSFVPAHGVYYAIPGSKTTMTATDVLLTEGDGKSKKPSTGKSNPVVLRGGFRLGMNVNGSTYGGPRPPYGHGPHRYFFHVVGLKERLDVEKMSPMATKAELAEAIRGKVVGWGSWVGIFERKWE